MTHLSIAVAFRSVRVIRWWRTFGRKTIAKRFSVAFAIFFTLLSGRNRNKSAIAVAALALAWAALSS
jgi:hypothetical protein